MKFYSSKTFGNDRGLSCAFRQWRADSHCRLIHGYSLGFKFIFEADSLNEKNWVYDFGNTKWIKEYLDRVFDHTLVVASDDPELDAFKELDKLGVCDLIILEAVGCEKFAEYVYKDIAPTVESQTDGRVRLKVVECFEHGSNSASYEG